MKIKSTRVALWAANSNSSLIPVGFIREGVFTIDAT